MSEVFVSSTPEERSGVFLSWTHLVGFVRGDGRISSAFLPILPLISDFYRFFSVPDHGYGRQYKHYWFCTGGHSTHVWIDILLQQKKKIGDFWWQLLLILICTLNFPGLVALLAVPLKVIKRLLLILKSGL